MSEVIITRSKWLITLVIDLQPYELLLAQLRVEIDMLEAARTQGLNYHRVLYSLTQESLILERQWKEMSDYLKGIKLLRTRQKRAVLPIIGKALGVLFGTVSEDEIRLIKRKLTQVEQRQQSTAQVVKESVSILNVTRLEVAINREIINWLIAYLHDLRQEMANVATTITTEYQELEDFLLKHLQLLAIVNRVRQTSHTLTVLLGHVRVQLDMLSMGQLSPSIITPERRRVVLLEIQSKLPHHLGLPADPTQQLWNFIVPWDVLPC